MEKQNFASEMDLSKTTAHGFILKTLPNISKALCDGMSWKEICEKVSDLLGKPVNLKSFRVMYYVEMRKFLNKNAQEIADHYEGNLERTVEYIKETFNLYISKSRLTKILEDYMKYHFAVTEA